MVESEVSVIVAAHKKFDMPTDKVYCPVLVGATFSSDENKTLCEGYLRDDEGDNISSLNKSFCELTGLYYAWKNMNSDYIGLVHYRRYFAKRRYISGSMDKVVSGDYIRNLLKTYRVIVPKKQRYFIETMYSHYAHTHYSIHLDKTREIIGILEPDYLEAFDNVMKQRSAYMFNMAIMSRELLNKYCNWLFPILFKLQEELSMPELSGFHGRYYGRVAEIIFNVWLQHQVENGVIKAEEIKELPIIYLEKINWFRKIRAFLGAKFLHRKYTGSF